MLINYLYPLFFFLIVIIALRYSKISHLDGLKRWDLVFAFSIKSFAALFFIYIFTFYYGEGYLYFDSGIYITDAKILNEVFYKSPLNYFKLLTGIGENTELIHAYLSDTGIWSQPNSIVKDDAKNIIRINSVIHFFSNNIIYIHFIIFNLFSLFGLVQIYLFFKKYTVFNHRILFYCLIISPSLLFWGSGVLKEPMVIFSYGLLLYILRQKFKFKIIKFILLVAVSYLLFSFKAYILVSILLAFIFFVFSKHIFKQSKLIYLFICQIVFFAATLLLFPSILNTFTTLITEKQFDFNNITKGGIYVKNTTDNYALNIPISQYSKIIQFPDSILIKENVLGYKMQKGNRKGIQKIIIKSDSIKKYKIHSIWSRSNSYVEPNLILYSEKQLIKNIPISLANSLLRPTWNDPSPKFKILSIIETYLIFGFLILGFIFKKKLSRNEKIYIISLFQFVLILSLFIGWTTPVFGAIVRYRIFTYLAITIISFILIKPFDQWKSKKNIS